MPNYYPNMPEPPNPPSYQQVYDQYGNPVGVVPVQPQNRIGTPSWWPRTQQPQQVYQQPTQPQQPVQSQSPSPPGAVGKWVKSESDVVPMDIPQDGSVVVFPQTDLQVIYLKKWEGNGTITTVPYIPNVSQEQKGQTPEQQFQESVQGRLSNIERALDSLINYISQPVQPQQPSRSKNSSKEEPK